MPVQSKTRKCILLSGVYLGKTLSMANINFFVKYTGMTGVFTRIMSTTLWFDCMHAHTLHFGQDHVPVGMVVSGGSRHCRW